MEYNNSVSIGVTGSFGMVLYWRIARETVQDLVVSHKKLKTFPYIRFYINPSDTSGWTIFDWEGQNVYKPGRGLPNYATCIHKISKL